MKDFSVIDVNAAGAGNVKIVQGPFKVMVKKQDSHFLNISQKDGNLLIDASFSSKKTFPDRYYDGFRVYISCPSISTINFDNKYIVDGKPFKDSVAHQYWNRQNFIEGFKTDTFKLNIDNGSYVIMDSNYIGNLIAHVGASSGSSPILEISKTNSISAASMAIQNNSNLNLQTIIPKFDCHLSDSASLFVAGYVTKSIIKQ